MLAFVLTFLLASFGVLIGVWYIVKYNYDRHLKSIKGPFPYPLIGSAHEFSGSATIIPKVMEFIKRFNGSFRIVIGFDHHIILADYKRLEFLLGTTKQISKGSMYKFLHSWLGQGLLTSTGDYWKQNRRIITPTFHFQILEQFLDVFHANSTIMVEKLAAEVGNPSVDIYPYVTNCALDIICETAMGTSVNAQSKDSEYVRAVKEMCRVLIVRTFSPVKQFDFLFRLSNDYRVEKRSLKILHDYTNAVIVKRRDTLLQKANESQQEVDSQKDDVGAKKRFAFLDVLLQARKADGSPMTNEEIRQEVDTFMFEGHDTTASAVSFCLHCLAHHAHVQRKVAEELRTIFGTNQDKPASYQNLQDMKYLDMVIKETLRLYPSVPAYAREVENELQFDGITYPKGTQLTVFAYGMHRDPRYFPDPDTFDPERFSPEKQMEPYCYVPFSAGSRNCVALQTIGGLLEEYGPVVKVMVGFDSFIFTSDYKFLEFMLTSNKVLKKSKPYNYLHNWLGQGLLTSTGEKWHQRRKVITPAFHFKILEQFVDVFDSASNILVQQLEKEVEKKSTDIYPYITLCALDIICETAMGTSVDAQRNQESEYVHSVKQMCSIIVDRSFSAIEQNDFLYPFTKNYKLEKRALNILHSYTNSVIGKRRQGLIEAAKTREILSNENNTDDIGQKRKMAFLDLLLQSTIDGKPLADEDIRQEVDTFMFEGHDTTTSAISFCLFNLAKFPHIQERVMKEQRDIFGADRDKMATYNDLQEMRYLEMVIKETLRMFPSVPFYARQLTEDIQINELLVPKGTNVNLFAFGIQRSPEFFENPDLFDPERFSAENVTKKHIYSYLPFSAGPRNCIGQKFAMLEMKSSISKVLRNYELHPVIPEHKVQLLAEAILKSSNGMILRLVKRNW